MSRHDFRLLADFTAAFPTGECPEYDCEPQYLVAVPTPREALTELRAALSTSLPPLYEQLLLSYRWPETDLGPYHLPANPAGPGLLGLLQEMKRDPIVWEELRRRGWIPFGKGADLNYDPVCFDMRRRRQDGDCRIVRLDHEELLCNSRINEVAELAPGFRESVRKIVEAARQHPPTAS